MNPDILIIGAGPVGLFTAIELKLRQPNKAITIVEKNQKYSRDHILHLEEESLRNSRVYQQYEAVRALHGYVPTSEIEKTLLNIALKLGIEVERGVPVTNCDELLTKYPKAKTIIAADGAHSVVRKQWFGDKKKIDKNLQYIVEIKYKATGSTQKLPRKTYVPALGQVPHLVAEHVGKEKNGTTPVSLFVFVDKETYNQVRKKPNSTLTDLKANTAAMARLLDTLKPWLALRKEALDEKIIPESEKINGVALNTYRAEEFAKDVQGRSVYLVGDAAAGYPYFRALNAGLIAAEVAVFDITAPFSNKARLNQQLALLADTEAKRSYRKNDQVERGRFFNFFLASTSKLSTGAMLTAKQEKAMLNARVKSPNLIRRNPRTSLTIAAIGLTIMALLTLSSVLILTGIGATIPVLAPLFLMVWPALILSVALPVLLIGVPALLFSVARQIKDAYLESQDPIKAHTQYDFGEQREASPIRLAKLGRRVRFNLPAEPAESSALFARDSSDVGYGAKGAAEHIHLSQPGT